MLAKQRNASGRGLAYRTKDIEQSGTVSSHWGPFLLINYDLRSEKWDNWVWNRRPGPGNVYTYDHSIIRGDSFYLKPRLGSDRE